MVGVVIVGLAGPGNCRGRDIAHRIIDVIVGRAVVRGIGDRRSAQAVEVVISQFLVQVALIGVLPLGEVPEPFPRVGKLLNAGGLADAGTDADRRTGCLVIGHHRIHRI